MSTKAWGAVAVVGLLMVAGVTGTPETDRGAVSVILMDVGMVALVVGVIGYVVQKRRNTTREGGRPGTSPARR